MLVSAAAFVSHAEITGYQSIVFFRTDGTALAIAMEDDVTVSDIYGHVIFHCDSERSAISTMEHNATIACDFSMAHKGRCQYES